MTGCTCMLALTSWYLAHCTAAPAAPECSTGGTSIGLAVTPEQLSRGLTALRWT